MSVDWSKQPDRVLVERREWLVEELAIVDAEWNSRMLKGVVRRRAEREARVSVALARAAGLRKSRWDEVPVVDENWVREMVKEELRKGLDF